MNLKFQVNALKSVMFAAVLLATGLSASPANAQASFRGKFTLQHETTWAGVVLPAGDYVITLDHGIGVGPATFFIRNAASGKSVGTVLSPVADGSADGEDALLTASRGSHSAKAKILVYYCDALVPSASGVPFHSKTKAFHAGTNFFP